MMSEVRVFESEEFGQVRTIVVNNDVWFVGKDVADSLGYSNSSKAVMVHVDEADRKKEMLAHSQNGNVVKTQTTLINESGMYALIFGSKLERAKKFKHWVTSEVLPAIRKTGGYVSEDDMFIANYLPFADDTTKSLFKVTLETVRKQNELIGEQNKQIEVMKPKEEFFDAVTDSKSAIPMGDVAKVLDMGVGRNKLFKILRSKKILMQNNRPYQSYIDRGLFRVIETRYDTPDGETIVNIKTLVYQKGVDFIRSILSK